MLYIPYTMSLCNSKLVVCINGKVMNSRMMVLGLVIGWGFDINGGGLCF